MGPEGFDLEAVAFALDRVVGVMEEVEDRLSEGEVEFGDELVVVVGVFVERVVNGTKLGSERVCEVWVDGGERRVGVNVKVDGFGGARFGGLIDESHDVTSVEG